MQSCFLLPYLLMIIVCNIHVHKKGEPAEHQPPLASGSLHPPQRRLGLAPPKHAVQVVVAAPKLGRVGFYTYNYIHISLGKDLLAIHTNGFLCQGVSKCVRLEWWEVQAVVGAALEKLDIDVIFNPISQYYQSHFQTLTLPSTKFAGSFMSIQSPSQGRRPWNSPILSSHHCWVTFFE